MGENSCFACVFQNFFVPLRHKRKRKEFIMATSMTLDYDLDDKRAVTMINLLLASGLFTQRPSIDAALEDVAAGRINHYSSLDELKAKFAHV